VSTHAPVQDAGHELVHEFAEVVGGGVAGVDVRAVVAALLEVVIAAVVVRTAVVSLDVVVAGVAVLIVVLAWVVVAVVVRTAVVSLDVVVAGVAVLIVVLDGVVAAQHCAPLLASVAHNAGVTLGVQVDWDTWAWIHL
jgi:hypothetical protein